MKITATKFLLTILIVTGSISAFGQKGVEDGSKYGKGEDSIRCVRNFSLYAEYYRQKSYDDALPYWRIVFDECPKASFNLYIHGVKMYEFLAEKADNEEQKFTYLDTMMLIYDQRIKYFGHEGKVLGRKGIDWLSIRKSTVEDIKIGYDYIKQSIDMQKNKSENAVLALFMTASGTLFKSGELSQDNMIQNYATASQIAEYKISTKPENTEYQKLKESIDGIFSKSGAATCEALIKLFQPKYDQNPEDKELLTKIVIFLAGTGCKDSDLYFNASTSFHKIEPSAKSAYFLAEMNVDRANYEKAAILYKQAIELETDSKEKARYYMKLGDITYHKLGSNSLARTFARKAAELDPESGHPYLLIGAIYADSEPCGDDDIAKKALYWIAVDNFAKAKQVDNELAEIANKSIVAYSQHFPDTETIFFHGLKEGDRYTVGCWINETTIVRTR
jgi:tetratricopeptide (TPR) repeat protein